MEERNGPDVTAIARDLYDWSMSIFSRNEWGAGLKDGSFFPILDYNGESYCPFVMWTYGRIESQFQYLRRKPPFDDEALREEARRQPNEIPGVVIAADGLTRRPIIRLSILAEPQRREQFKAVTVWTTEQIRSK